MKKHKKQNRVKLTIDDVKNTDVLKYVAHALQDGHQHIFSAIKISAHVGINQDIKLGKLINDIKNGLDAVLDMDIMGIDEIYAYKKYDLSVDDKSYAKITLYISE